jgi:hypothetical protein
LQAGQASYFLVQLGDFPRLRLQLLDLLLEGGDDRQFLVEFGQVVSQMLLVRLQLTRRASRFVQVFLQIGGLLLKGIELFL